MNTNPSVLMRTLRWFDPRGRALSNFGFVLNRITGLGLTLYLFLHLIVLGLIARGPDAYNEFLRLIESPIMKLGELLVVAALFIHGLNGIRIGLNSVGIAVPRQRELFIGVLVLSVIAIAFFGWKMFLA